MTDERQNTVTVTVIEINKDDLGVLRIRFFLIIYYR